MAESQLHFDSLSIAEKILHVQELWDRIAAASTDEVGLTDAQGADLDRRLQAHRADPDRGSSWEEALDRVRSRR